MVQGIYLLGTTVSTPFGVTQTHFFGEPNGLKAERFYLRPRLA